MSTKTTVVCDSCGEEISDSTATTAFVKAIPTEDGNMTKLADIYFIVKPEVFKDVCRDCIYNFLEEHANGIWHECSTNHLQELID